jgi:hypothetical protein
LENIMDLCTPVVLSFLRQTLISCNLSWLWKKKLQMFHIASFSSIHHCRKSCKISSQLTQTCDIPIFAFLKGFGFSVQKAE